MHAILQSTVNFHKCTVLARGLLNKYTSFVGVQVCGGGLPDTQDGINFV
jgi:hypothetical protein